MLQMKMGDGRWMGGSDAPWCSGLEDWSGREGKAGESRSLREGKKGLENFGVVLCLEVRRG
jgi:hypothetical protein